MRCIFSLFALAALIGRAAIVPPFYINSVVAIGHNEPNNDVSQRWVTEASGFFYGYLVQNDTDPAMRRYEIYLVTNRHVIANHDVVSVRMNPKKTSDEGQVFAIPGKDLVYTSRFQR